jgi:hypothetical protein
MSGKTHLNRQDTKTAKVPFEIALGVLGVSAVQISCEDV